jgi:hypothetical protein
MATGGMRTGQARLHPPTTRHPLCHNCRRHRRHHCWSLMTTTNKGTSPHGPTVPSGKSLEECGDGPPTEPHDVRQRHQHPLCQTWKVSLHPHCSSHLAAGRWQRMQAQPFLAEAGSFVIVVIVLDFHGSAGIPHPHTKAAGPYLGASPHGAYSHRNCNCHQRCRHQASLPSPPPTTTW